MESEGNWGVIIEKAMKMLESVGIKYYKNVKSIEGLNRLFCDKLTFPHPNKMVQHGKIPPLFLQTYPEAEKMVSQWFSENI